MQIEISEIREDDSGRLWFLVKDYYRRASGEYEDYWLHLSDEYSNEVNFSGPVKGPRYELRRVEE